MKEDRGAVLGSPIRTLPVELSRIVVLPEPVQEFLVGKRGRIVFDFHRLGVAGAIGANILVSGISEVSAGVANPGRDHARQLAESGFNSPETACRKGGFSHVNKTPAPIIATSD